MQKSNQKFKITRIILRNRTFVYAITIIEAILTIFSIFQLLELIRYLSSNFQRIQHIEFTNLMQNTFISLVIWIPYSYFVYLVLRDYVRYHNE